MFSILLRLSFINLAEILLSVFITRNAFTETYVDGKHKVW